MRGLETRQFFARLSQAKIVAATLVTALVLVLVGPTAVGFAASPGIASVAPTGGPTTGGGTMTITGLGFGTQVPAVTIGGTAASDVVLVDDSTVTATIPAGSPGLADVVVTPVGGEPLTLSSGYEYAAPAQYPVFDTIAPATGPTTAGEPVTISGAYLEQVERIRFGSTDIDWRNFVSRGENGTSITVIAPYGAVGSVDVTLTTSSGTSVTKYGAYTYVAPTIASISPTSGPSAGGTAVTIAGTGFGTSGSVSVSIAGAAASNVVRVDPTRITATTGMASVGVGDVVVTITGVAGAPGPVTITGVGLYTVAPSVATPTISAVTPNSGPVSGGQSVTVTGTNFRAGNGSLATITFGGVSATVQSIATNGKSMTVVVPAHAAGAVDVQVSTVDGRATSRNGYTYNPAPVITGLSPASGIVAGGTFVTLTGSGFGATGVPVVTIDGRAATCVTRLSDTTISFVAPAGTSTGARTVEVTPATRGGSASLAGGYTYVAATTTPTISSVSPSSGLTSGGTTITLRGTGFTSATTPSVLVGGSCATDVVVVDATTITATTPTGVAGVRDVVVTTSTGQATAAASFTYRDAPAILTLSPSSGSTAGGQTVVITGRGFGETGTPVVTIGGQPVASVERLSDTQIRIVTQPGAPGAQAVQVTPAGGSTLNKPNAYTYLAPTVTSLQPYAGSTRGGTKVTITGTGFGDSGTPVVTFGGVPATSVVRVSSTQVTAVTPAHESGAVAVVVTPATGPSSGTKGNAFSYVTDVVTPIVTSSLPSRGPSEGGITVYVAGENFIGTNSVPATVTVGGVAATSVVVAADGESLTFRAPALAPGRYDLVVTTNEGSTTVRWAYTVAAPPVIDNCSAVSPRETSPEAGTSVTVTGSGFGASGTPTVTVGGVPATVLASSDTSVTFRMPGGPVGYPQIVVRPTTGGSPLTIDGCLLRTTEVRIEANSRVIQFGDPTPTFTATATGLYGDDALQSTSFVFSGNGYGPSTVPPTNAGTYTLMPADAVLSPGQISNYTVEYVSGLYIIRGFEATLKAVDTSKVYGDDDPEFSYTSTGLRPGHTITGAAFEFWGIDGTSYGPSTTPPTDAGTYRFAPTAAHVGGAESNYSFTYQWAYYTITPRPITIGAIPAFKVYGDADPAFEWTVRAGSLAYDDALPGTLSREEGEDVGQYDILQGSVDDPNYTITYLNDVLDITPRPISVTAADASKVYGDADPELTGESEGLLPGDYLDGYLAREPGENVGSYEITRGTLSASANYEIVSFSSGTFTITPRPLTVTLGDASKTYGDADPALLAEISEGSLVGGDQLSGSPSRAPGEDVGSYAIGGGSITAGANYEISFIDGLLTIEPRPIEVTADDQSKQYGDADPSPLAYTVTRGSLVGTDTLTGTLSRDEGEAVGVYAITPGSLGAGPNYEITVVGGELEIEPRSITVTADAATQVYGDADAALTWQVTSGSLVPGDSLDGQLDREPGTDVGEYAIGRGSLGNDSYTITFVPAELTITARPLTITADPASKEYGETDPQLTATADNLVEGDSLTGSLVREPGENVDSYAITAGTIGAGTNYTVSFQAGTFEITPRSLELRADDLSAEYGDPAPTPTVSVSAGALVPGDVLGAATFAPGILPTDAGEYSITPTGVAFASGSASNYEITFVAGTLVISPLAVEIAPDSLDKRFGEADPVLTYAASPVLVDGDEFSGALGRDSGEGVGRYAVTLGSLSAGPNYELTLAPAEFEILSRTIEVTAHAASKVYGDGDPVLEWEVTGGELVEGDPLTGSLSREPGEDAGSYRITLGDLGGGNYDIDFVDAGFTIEPRPVSLEIDNAEKQYGDEDPEFTYSADGLVNGDSLSGAPSRNAGEAVGEYEIGLGTLEASPNYIIAFVDPGVLTVTKRTITIAPTDKEIVYGDSLGSLDYSVIGGSLVDGDSIESVDVDVLGYTGDAGAYTLEASGAVIDGGASNYDVMYITGTLWVSPLEIVVTADDITKEYGDADPAFSWTSSPALIGDDALSGSLARDPGEDVGTYAITAGTLSGGSNYTVTVASGELEITVRTLEVTAQTASKTYGDADPSFGWSITSGSLLPGDSLSGELSRESGEDVGEYAITIGSLDNPNYVVEFVPADLTITARPIVIQVQDASKQYGDTDPELTATSADLVFEDTLTGSPEREPGEAVGEYEIGAGSLSASTNYTVTSVEPGEFTIGQRSITIAADDQEIVYGDAIDPDSFTIVEGSLAGADELDGVELSASPTGVGSVEIAASDARFATGDAANYAIQYRPGTLTVTPRPITVIAQAAIKTYGDPDPVIEYSLTEELQSGDSVSGALGREPGEGVGDYAVTLGSLGAGPNYELSLEPAIVTITPRHLTIFAQAATKTYGDADPALTFAMTGLLEGDSLSGELSRDPGEDVGGYAIRKGTLNNENYAISFESANLTITERTLTVTFDSVTKTYGDSDPELTFALDGLVGGDSVSGTATRLAGEDVGQYGIGLGSLNAGSNYVLELASGGSFTIEPRPLVIAADDAAIAYGDSLPAVGYSITEGTLVTGDALGSVSVAIDGAAADAGSYAIVAGDAVFATGSIDNYDIQYRDGTLTIEPRSLTVAAQDASKTYGDTDPVFGFDVDGLLPGDETTGSLDRTAGEDVATYLIRLGTVTAGPNYAIDFTPAYLTIEQRPITVTPLSGQSKVYGDGDPSLAWSVTSGSLVGEDSLSGSLGREAGEDVGDYAITIGTLGNGNYAIELGEGDFAITSKPITVSAQPATSVYGDADAPLEVTTDGLVGDDELSGAPSRTAGSAVGEYTILVGTISAGPNYTITFETAAYSITPRPVTVAADDQTIDYGDADPELTFEVTDGSVLGIDEFSGTLVRAAGDDAGEYAITQGTLALGSNYSLTVEPGTLTIEPRVIGITAVDASKVYGDADPALLPYSVTSGDLAAGDTPTGTLVREAGEHVGEYAILPGTLDAGPNYRFTVEGGTFEITPRPIEVTADNSTEVFGEPDPEFSWSVTDGGLIGTDALTGALDREAGDDVGDYAIRLGSLGNADYEISFVPATHSITPRPLTVTGDDVQKVYGASDPILSATVDGLVGDDQLGGAPVRESGEDVGTYRVLRGTLTAGSNYEIVSFEAGSFEITQRPIGVTVDDQSIVFGDEDPELTWSVTSGSLVGGDAISGVPERESGADVGEYRILTGSLDAGGNYGLVVTPGTLEITPRDATVVVSSEYTDFGEPTPAFTLTPVGLIEGDALLASELEFDGSSDVPVLPGFYEVGASILSTEAGPASNYRFSIEAGSWLISGPNAVYIDPPSGLTIGGLPFEIHGTGFGVETPVVLFDGVPATDVVLVGPGLIQGFTPEHAVGVVTVSVQTAGGTTDLVDAYTYVEPVPGPSIYSLSPGRGPVDGGTEVTIVGEHLVGTDGQNAVVLIDGVDATSVVVAEDGLSLTAVSPEGQVGPRDVDVLTVDGGVTFIQGFEYYDGPAGTVRGSLWLDLDEDGEWDASESPLVGVTVQLVPESDPVSGRQPAAALAATATTDADGEYVLENIPYGEWTLQLTGPGGTVLVGGAGSSDVAIPVTVDSGELVLDVPLVGRSAIVDALVRYTDGTAAPGATVTLRWAGPDGVLGTGDDVLIVVVADADGRFSVSGLPAGRYEVSGTDGSRSFGPVELTLEPLTEVEGAVFEIDLASPPAGGGGDASLAATGLDVMPLALGALVLLLLGAIIVGRAGRRELR
ncbi:MBG domain-containing protein [Salinibacterium soli]|uniref:MBG domain-containing protein n=1 Tax=Antiquaquibacter soli TaxID=3064523 RepID=A0ABT9BQN2_9MICO|nr:MBG domain-containing protein [Protaetiibacter sp. WY-16]MDO7882939.1 MBG domain-containing protein [Protaetiibacter sp. WY-16]